MKKIILLILIFSLHSITFAQDVITCSGVVTFMVPPITKAHPRMWYSEQRLKDLRSYVSAKKEPIYTTYLALLEAANVAMKYIPKPYTGKIPNEHRFEGVRMGEKVLVLALTYRITLDTKYAEAAIHKLDEWISTKPMPGTTFENTPITVPTLGMATTLPLCSFLEACDLLYGCPAWNKDFELRFDAYLNVQQKNIMQSIKDWSGIYHGNPNGPGWIPSDNPKDRSFGGQLWQNHNGCNTMGIAAIAYYKGDRQLAQYALDCIEHIYNLKNLIENAILIPGDLGINRKDSASIRPGEMYDRYRHYDPGKGISYSCWHLQFLLNVAELAYQNGLNVYAYKSAKGKSLELALNFLAQTFLSGPEEAKKGFYNDPEEIGQVRNVMNLKGQNSIFLLGHLRYPNNAVIAKIASGINRSASNNFNDVEVGSWILSYDNLFK